MKTSDATLKLLASDSYLVDRGGMQVFWGWYTYNVHFEWGEEGGKVKMRCYRSQGGGYRVFWTSNLYFVFSKENWICAMTRHHANNISLARNLPFDSEVRQGSHPLMIPLHCLWAKSNNRMRGHFECDVALCFYFSLISFIHMHGAAVGL